MTQHFLLSAKARTLSAWMKRANSLSKKRAFPFRRHRASLRGMTLNMTAMEPAEAKRILDKLEFHYTPKHGSWLNMAELELSPFKSAMLRQTDTG